MDNKLTEKQKIELEINTNTETDNLTQELQNQEYEAFNNYTKKQMELLDIDPNYVPYQFRTPLEEQAFANKNKINLGINAKIYDDRGLPIDEKYHKNFTLEQDPLNPSMGHTINSIDRFYTGQGFDDNQKEWVHF